VSWGQDTNDQVSGTPAGDGFVAVDAGLLYSMALHSDGSVVSWGGGLAASPNRPAGSGFKAIGAGYNIALGITDDGELSSWNLTGLPAGNGFVQVRAGNALASALDTGGILTLFGSNTSGVLQTPVPSGTFTSADTGYYHAAGILNDGSLVSWGGSLADSYGLVQNFTDGPYIAVAAGTTLGVGLRANGTLHAYGNATLASAIPADRDGYVAVAVSQNDNVVAIRRVSGF
jgi:hypothetical protein